MTDPKPATRATDEEIALRHTRGKSENQYWDFQQMLVARIAADAETIRKQAEEIEALRQAFGLLSTLAPKVVMGPSSPAEVIVTAQEIHKGVSDEIARLKAERAEK